MLITQLKLKDSRLKFKAKELRREVVFLIALTLSVTQLSGQINIELSKTVKGLEQNELKNPWVGGLNSVHLAEIDLNFDGILDLFVYDLEGQRKLTFINNNVKGEVSYTYDPSFASAFDMEIENFFQFLDYNNDGKKDLFIAFNGGLKVYKNISSSGPPLLFQEYTYLDGFPYLTADYSGTRSNLFVSRGDAPAIADVDFDGDLDVLSFGNLGGRVNYFKNNAVEKGDLERLDFELATSCWGNFEEAFDSEEITLGVSCKGNKSSFNDKGNKHAGSTLLAFDADADNDMDLLVGDILSYNMVFLENGGDSLFADMISQTTQYPADKPIDFRIYPAAHLIDLNNDGKRDLIVTPNTLGAVENAKSLWHYENIGTDNAPVFEFKELNFLQNEMIELGEGAYPVFVDMNSDSILDLVVGNYGLFSENDLATSLLQYYQNQSDLGFILRDTNIGGISSLILNQNLNTPTLNLMPTFGDLDGDGDEDLIVGDFEGKLHYFENNPQDGKSFFTLSEANFQNIDVGGYAAPQLFDLNQDGLLDLVIGERNGVLNYYRNAGNRFSPEFELVSENLGEVDVVPDLFFTGYSQPFFYYSGDTIKLMCGSQSGTIYYYDGINGNLDGKFNLISEAFGGIDVGNRSAIAGADIDKDGLMELIIGNYSGGLTYYESSLKYTGIRENTNKGRGSANFDYEIAPIPSNGLIRLLFNRQEFGNTSFNIRIFNSTGGLVYEKLNSAKKEFDLRGFSAGSYVMQLSTEGTTVSKTFIIQSIYENN